MILADKIIALRKKNDWSQEELAERMRVTRQSVSKWEGAQSVPDLDKILLLSQLFGVSCDYLLKDDCELSAPSASAPDEADPPLRRVSMEEANAFLAAKEQTADKIALGALLCVLSPVCLMFLAAASEAGALPLSENAACGVGLIALFVLVAVAVALFISSGMKTSAYEYLEKEEFETAYGVDGMAREKQARYKDTYARKNLTGACLCVLSVIPLFSGLFFTQNDWLCVALLCVTFALAGLGAYCFIGAGVRWASLQKLLQEGDYAREKKRGGLHAGAISTVYWLVVTAGFLAYALPTNDWQRSWIVWPVAGVLFAALMTLVGAFQKHRRAK